MSRKVCRYAGYTLTKEIEKLDETLSTDLLMLFLIPSFTIAVVSKDHTTSSSGGLGLVAVCYVAALGFFIFRLFKTGRTLRAKRMGVAGERVVGQEVRELLRHGFHVFHDFPLDGENIDHVVVGPSGVFAIETKYRRKRKDEKDGHKVFYNGTRLRFGKKETSAPLAQSKRQVKKLSEMLSPMFGATEVTPILVFVGWWVEMEKGVVEVLVLNEKGVVGYLSKQPGKLDPKKVGQIAAYLEEKCRDVEV